MSNDERVAEIVVEVSSLLRKINQNSLSATFGQGGGMADMDWQRIRFLGQELNAIGGRELMLKAINEIRREQTMMASNLEQMWLGRKVKRLP
jgi:hypothetical protein